MTRAIETVFVVDDQADIRMISARALRLGTQWRVEAFASGAACIEALATSSPDLILLDVMMPGLDGPATLSRLRESGCEAPVILMTARTGRRQEAEYEQLGATGVIAKPFDPLTLVTQVEALLGSSSFIAAVADDDDDEDLTAVFLRQLDARMHELGEALGHDSVDEAARLDAKRVAHSLAGSSGTFGFHELGRVAGCLETLLEEEPDAAGWAQIRETRRELEQLVAGLQSED